MRQREAAFVDSGAWIALALIRGPLHGNARGQWDILLGAGSKLYTPIPVVIETFTFLERNTHRDVALAWKESIHLPGLVEILPCELSALEKSWQYFQRDDLHKLLAVDATSFAIMNLARILVAVMFDHYFFAGAFDLWHNRCALSEGRQSQERNCSSLLPPTNDRER